MSTNADRLNTAATNLEKDAEDVAKSVTELKAISSSLQDQVATLQATIDANPNSGVSQEQLDAVSERLEAVDAKLDATTGVPNEALPE